MRQDVDVAPFSAAIDAGEQWFAFEAYLRTHCGMDAAQVVLEFRDGGGAVLGTFASCRYLSTQWGRAAHTAAAPPSTRIVRVRLRAWANSGTAADGYFDDVSLVACDDEVREARELLACGAH